MPRPKLEPTAQERARVKLLAALGTPHEDIARMIGIRSPKTLRKHFGQELARAAVEANANVGGALYNKAIAGDVAAQKFWLSCRAGWRPATEPLATASQSTFEVKVEVEKAEQASA